MIKIITTKRFKELKEQEEKIQKLKEYDIEVDGFKDKMVDGDDLHRILW